MAVYILSQCAAVLSTAILLIYTLMKVERRTILICNIIINSLLSLHYLLLCAYSGAACSALCAVMVLVFSFKHKNRYTANILIPILFAVIFAVSGLLTWQSSWSVIPIIGNILLVIALWNDKAENIKAIFIVVGLLWIVYNSYLGSAANVIGQCLAVSCNIIYFVRQKQKSKTIIYTESEKHS